MMAVENFVQIPNKMFVDTNNDEKLVYVKLLQSQMVGYFDKDNRTTMTTVPVLVMLLGWAEGKYSNKKVEVALNGLKEKGYISFDSSKKVFVVSINTWDNQEKYELDVDWRENNITFSGHTQIKYSVIDNLLEDKDFTLYAYAEYRTMKKHQYRICNSEWAVVLGCKERQAFDIVDNSDVIIKVSHGYNKNTKRRETNSYLTFDKAELAEETSKKPTYEAQDEPEKVAEPVVEETTEDVVEDEKVEETVTETISAEDTKEFKEQTQKMFGTTMMDNIFKSMNDPEIDTVEKARQVQDFDYPMSARIYNIVKTSDDYKVREYGENKLKSKLFKEKHKDALNAELRELAQKKAMQADENKYHFKRFVVFYADGTKKLIDFETFNEWKTFKRIDGDEEYGYGFSSEMTEDEGQYGTVKVLSFVEAMKELD
ncbi:hypothetical protein EA794_07405 [Lactococcus petauri]|uniref:hypothetical protein n=1 Tax=Lactococcus petauri TaxID=1940789 RepID=UPI0013FE2E69|nr:hypothetical protein [Lactococcus petauri]NHI75798.1 hypothetical protein [Lactococcus petauri]